MKVLNFRAKNYSHARRQLIIQLFRRHWEEIYKVVQQYEDINMFDARLEALKRMNLKGNPAVTCFLCYWSNCVHCPIDWLENSCCHFDSPFGKLIRAQETLSKQGKLRLIRQIINLPERKTNYEKYRKGRAKK